MATIGVRFEGTLSKGCDFPVGDWGKPEPRAIKAVEALYEAGHRIVVVTSAVQVPGTNALPMIQNWLIEEGVPFHEVWVSFGFPTLDHYIDATAVPPGKVKVSDG